MNWTQHKGGSQAAYELIYTSSNTARNFATQMAAETDWDGTSEAVFNVIINSGVTLSAGTTTGSFPGSSLVTCRNDGTIRGTNCSGDDGLDLQHNLTLDNTNGTISGGGGSAGNAGAGGAGGWNGFHTGEECSVFGPMPPGAAGSAGSCGTYGNAGNPGNPGSSGSGGPSSGTPPCSGTPGGAGGAGGSGGGSTVGCPGSPGGGGSAGNAGGAAGYAIRLNGNTRTNAGTGTINGTVG